MVLRWTASLAETVADALAPRRCAVCDAEGASLCGRCAGRLLALPAPPPRAGLLAAFPYEADVRRALHRGKYRDGRAALRRLAEIAGSRIRPPAGAAVVAVPLGMRRLRERGYNQAELVARVWARCWSVPLVDGLRRMRETPPQVGADPAARRRNVEGAFRWAGGPAPETAVLVDDVVTTGATTRSAAAALRAAGCRDVVVAALARAADPHG